MNDIKTDKRHLIHSLIFPMLFVILLWLIKILEFYLEKRFTFLGLYPLKAEGLIGIITSPLIHGNWKHLFNNTFPLLFLSWGIFYFYKEIAWKVILTAYFTSQLWLWFFARDGWHIGASGLIYAFGAFIFVSGIIRKNRHLLAISMLVAFLYGSMVWGILPVEEHISWEGHLMGMLAGIILAFHYKAYGPPLPNSDYPEEEDDLDFDDFNREEKE